MESDSSDTASPVWLPLGVALVVVAWPLNWLLDGLRSHVIFFPLWLGYVLVVDGLVKRRRGTSILARSPRAFASLFVASVPIWWLFELLNRRIGNWEYLGAGAFGDLEYAFWASLSFSTVVPAVFETAELLSTFAGGGRFRRPARPLRIGRTWALLAAGLATTVASLAWPGVLYPLLWIGPLLAFEAIAHAAGTPSLLAHLERGELGPLVHLPLGALTCGFFWELWNFYAFPKWIYHVPGLDFARLFEMPALGYLGYLPFGASLYSMAHLVLRSRGNVSSVLDLEGRGRSG